MASLSFLICIFGVIKCVIPIEEYVVISLASNPEYEVAIEGQIIRLKKPESENHKPGDPNLLKLYLEGGYYHMRFLDYSMYNKIDTDEIVGEVFDEDDMGFFFDIVSVEGGSLIKMDERCLEKSEFDADYNGYTIELKKCAANKNQKFLIKRVPIQVRDNRRPAIDIMEFEKIQNLRARKGCRMLQRR